LLRLAQDALPKRLRKINVSHNENIVDLTVLPHLKILIAEGSQRNINNKTIENLALRELYIAGNLFINNVLPLRKTLRILDVSYNEEGRCGVTQRGIQNGPEHLRLIELKAIDNFFITDVSFMKNTLKVSKCEETCGIGQ